MNSFSTLSLHDRAMVNFLPDVILSAHTERFDGQIAVEFDYIRNGEDHRRSLTATQIGNDCFDVRVENLNFDENGDSQVFHSVEFITTGTWVNEWSDRVHELARKHNV